MGAIVGAKYILLEIRGWHGTPGTHANTPSELFSDEQYGNQYCMIHWQKKSLELPSLATYELQSLSLLPQKAIYNLSIYFDTPYKQFEYT